MEDPVPDTSTVSASMTKEYKSIYRLGELVMVEGECRTKTVRGA
jgi:hypothetical protein